MFISETRTKGISNRPWPNDYNWITNRRYKVWKPQGRILDKFTVLEEPKEEQKPHLFWFLFNNLSITMSACYLYVMTQKKKKEKKRKEKKNVLNNKTLNKSWFGLKLANSK